MRSWQREFLELALELEVLKFGSFKLKSGRMSPYFFNAGLFNTGYAAAKLGRCYASAIAKSGVEFDMVFGPAYKGIPLASTTAVALADHHDRDLPYAFNRKEVKDHGEGGNIVGAALEGRVLIIDDVITAGTAIRESLELIRANGAAAVGVAVMMDRQERGRGELSAIGELKRDHALDVIAIANLDGLIEFCARDDSLAGSAEAMAVYREEYGVAG